MDHQLLRICALVVLTSGCPLAPPCECEKPSDRPGVNIINCRYKNLQRIPLVNASTEYYEELTLVGNSIQTIPSAAFSGLLVKRIYIEDNPISAISPNAFLGVEDMLEELYLHGDKESPSLPAPWAVLGNLTSLTLLKLSHFNIGMLENSTVLVPFRNLKSLTISSCQLHYISPTMFDPVNRTLTKLDLSSNTLQSIPVSSLRSLGQLRTLSMSSNRIRRIGYDAFSANMHLDELNLLQNEISALEDGCFNQTENSLTFLGLNLNNIPGDQLLAIHSLRALQQLNLGYNPIMSIPAATFTNMHNLNFLNLQSAQLQTLSASTFAGLADSLSHLMLSGNHLTQIEAGTFSAMTSLLELDLDSQSMPLVLVPGVFRGLENTLDTLYLDGTRFGSQGSWDAIKDLESLKFLNLAKNDLSDIPDFIFAKMGVLSTLHLDENNLATIRQEQLHGLRESLTKLHLEKNDITSFDHCAIANFSKLLPEFTKLDGNPLDCDCRLKWLSKWVEKRLNESNDSTLLIFIAWTCADGRIFREIEPENLVCTSNYKDPECADYYSTTTSTTSTTTTTTTEPPTTMTTTIQPTTTQPTVLLELNVAETTNSIIKVEWDISHPSVVDYFQLRYENVIDGNRQGTGQLHRLSRHYELRGLKEGQTYEICLFVYYKDLQHNSDSNCVTNSTATMATPGVATEGAMNGDEIGIIVGASLGGLFLILIIIAIVFILVRHQRQENVDDKPIEPAPWTRAGQPQMGYDSKRFTKQKKAGSSEHHIKEIRHVQVDPSNLQRTSGGSYQYLDETVSPRKVNGTAIGLNISPHPPQKPQGKGLDTSDMYHKYYEIALDGIESHI